jgi:Pyruvate/2-oxoacid:ferredoxin oxidoreductase gamma subunit
MINFITDSINLILVSISNLFIIAFAFGLLALLIKRKAALAAFRAALPDSVFNINVMALNLIIIPPLLIAI